jgi:hypothetical protein
MKHILAFLEKLLSSLLLLFFISFLSFSYMTGHFPPRKGDINRAYHLMKGLLTSTQDYNNQVKGLQGQAPSLEQMLEIQKLALKRLEFTVQLKELFPRLPSGEVNPVLAEKLQKVQQSFSQAEKDMEDINQILQKAMEGK